MTVSVVLVGEMEQHKKEGNQEKNLPRVPIKTYRWEDLRRSRLKGGYPWTYLYKDPFDEDLHPENFTMEAMRKSKSASALGVSGVEINEILNTDDTHSNITDPDVLISEALTESNNHSKNNKLSSLEIEEEEPELLNLESAESSDNISQYLDKEERSMQKTNSGLLKVPSISSRTDLPETSKSEEERKSKAKSEEPKRKRKSSIESSYSRISKLSLSKLGLMKKFREFKDKIKVPKLSISTPNLFKSSPKEEEKAKSEESTKSKEESKKIKELKNVKSKTDRPVYIHIPLKPPPGKTDEFSYLEFEEKREPEDKPQPKIIQETPPPDATPLEHLKIINNDKLMEPRPSIDNPDEIVAIEIVKSETIDLDQAANQSIEGLEIGEEHLDNNIFIIEQGSGNAENDDVIIILSGSEEPKLSRTASVKLAQSIRKSRAKSAEPERKRKSSIESSYSRMSLSKLGLLKKLRDAKDKIKFPKFSLSRSNSKKEKKEDKVTKPDNEEKKEDKKEEKEPNKKSEKTKTKEPQYIHIPLKPPPGESDEFSYLEFESPTESSSASKIEEKIKDDKKDEESSIESPVQSSDVQFIFLTPPSDDEILDQPDIPETPSSDNRKFFDNNRVEELKKLAKGAVDKISPESQAKLETVNEENNSDKVKIGEVEVTSNVEEIETSRPITSSENNLTIEEKKEEHKTITEESKNKLDEKTNIEETQPEETKPKIEDKQEEERMIVDEEDGLKQSNVKLSKADDLIKSSLKREGSPILRKKVSFKRRSKSDSKEKENEDATKTTEATESKEAKEKLAILGNSQSMSVDEEKTYLDDKIIKSASLEEDYNKWSKLSDHHEYEPINTPTDDSSAVTASPPIAQIVDTDQESRQKAIRIEIGSSSSLDCQDEESYTTQDMQNEIEDRYFNTADAQQNPSKKGKSKKDDNKKNEGPNKFQLALKAQAGKFKNKLHGIKKPNLTLPARPKFTKPNMDKFKFQKPKFNLPKIPDTTRITLPSFSLPRKTTTTTTITTKRTLKERQLSTESNAGDSKKKFFDFRTYPRIFRKKSKGDFDSSSTKNESGAVEFATVPRVKGKKGDSWQSKETNNDTWGGQNDNIRIPLHQEDSVDIDDNNINRDREDSVERRMASHIRYLEDIDNEDAIDRENEAINRASPFSNNYNTRWNHGSFHPQELERRERDYKITDLDSPEDPALQDSFDTNTSIKDIDSSESSFGFRRQGVLEEIDSDEFFLRQKGISQDNIEVGMYLSSEIREAFKSPPINSLLQMENEPESINQTNKSFQSKKKSNKKPKRKKTPHVSQEQISYDLDESEPEQYLDEIPPPRPIRRSKKRRKENDDKIIPYQEVIKDDLHNIESLGILAKSDDECRAAYENERMTGKEQPDIKITDPYKNIKYEERYNSDEEPAPPPRKNRSRSLKSLSDSLLDEIEAEGPKPPRSLSRGSLQSREFSSKVEAPRRPSRTKSQSRGTSLLDEDETSRLSETFASENPCVEEPCRQEICDYMGYAIIDKQKVRDPPLPPPRTPPRRKKSINSAKSSMSELGFFTVPRTSHSNSPPVRPLRNYSTLGPSRPPRKKQLPNLTDEEKENIDITQYIEIEDDSNRDNNTNLNSGEVIQKMKDRPLPPPPRPPRKPRSIQDGNISEDGNLEETEVSTQTEPLPEDFICEEVQQEESDKILTPSVTVERHLITPTHYTHEETVTHAALIVEPLNGARILPDSQMSVERRIPITKDYEDETSEVPEDFKKLKDPPASVQPQGETKPQVNQRPAQLEEVDLLKTQKLQVSDLDVDRLTVNELLANRIIVSEIDSSNIQVNEINSKTGALRIGEIELPPGVIQQLLNRIQQEQSNSETKPESLDHGDEKCEEKSDTAGQKKTPIEQIVIETEIVDSSPQRPPRKTEEIPLNQAELTELTEISIEQTNSLNSTENEDLPPQPPQRLDSKEKNFEQDQTCLPSDTPQRPPRHKIDNEDLEIDDEPPPRPPQPQIDYIPSQPPASFYALRAQQYVENLDDNIPTVPRRRRHYKPPISRSSSEDSPVTLPSSRRRYRSPEPTIPELTGQLVQACGSAANNSIRRLIAHITDNVLRNADGKQDLHVVIVILLILIAGLILLGYGDGKTVHYHHWEFFNPPRDM